MAVHPQQIQLPYNGNELDEALLALENEDPVFRSTLPGDSATIVGQAQTGTVLLHEEISTSNHGALTSIDAVLSATRVYGRVSTRDVGAVTTISTIRSQAWSILSCLSLRRVSAVAVIKLPVHNSELRRFGWLLSPSALNSNGALTADERKIDHSDTLLKISEPEATNGWHIMELELPLYPMM